MGQHSKLDLWKLLRHNGLARIIFVRGLMLNKPYINNCCGQTATSIAVSVLAAEVTGSVVFGVTGNVEKTVNTSLEVLNWTGGVAGPAVTLVRQILS
jgi:hypothetical protein